MNGSKWFRSVVAVLAASGAVTLTASSAEAHSRVKVTINQACDDPASGWTTFAFGAYRHRDPVLDDGSAQLQVFDVSGRSVNPWTGRGQWRTFNLFGDDNIPSDDDLLRSGGEEHLRFNERYYGQYGGHALYYRILFAGGVSQSIGVDTELNCSDPTDAE